MHIQELKLSDFRNYREGTISFGPGINILYGDNAQGKTNILEAIYLCATSKSHRTNLYKEMIRLGRDEAHVHLRISKQGGRYVDVIDLHLKSGNKKGIAVNKKPIRKMQELLGVAHVILFSPEDLGLIKHGPKERRRFMNVELSQVDPVYYFNLSQYHKVLKQRNNLLRSIQFDPGKADLLEPWDLQLAAYGRKIIQARMDFVSTLEPIFQEMHKGISGSGEAITMAYEKNVEPDLFEGRLLQARSKDVKTGSTTVGPHLDDLFFGLGGVDLRKYGSQGQQRTAALSLKLSEIEWVGSSIEDTPVLLLDDVLSELDRHRQLALMKVLNNIQTIITCTGVEDFMNQNITIEKMYCIEKGQIYEKNL
ncbi:DNA replication/repair protein RecF [Anaerotalea alkaliphila]|uniref:DNA replication and repair protein RecF n=1 Tax=Anaerotalea alkaliphila TaxID=2662126 RepID=A0A7X5HWS4_9FIRM|nr:DNA replication/repair protein RecF [Anaerotalea alkaliphila]NDL68094.1 DNA replication/repair protein RecF [Anaerotalea alkaliphila]